MVRNLKAAAIFVSSNQLVIFSNTGNDWVWTSLSEITPDNCDLRCFGLAFESVKTIWIIIASIIVVIMVYLVITFFRVNCCKCKKKESPSKSTR